MGQMIPGCSCQKAADHGTGTGCEKNGAEAVNTGMKHPVCKERAVGAHVQYKPAHNAGGNKVLIDEGIIFRLHQTFPDFMERMPFFHCSDDGIHIHAAVGKNNGYQGQGIHEENSTVGKIFQEERCQKRTRHTGNVEIGRVQADGAVKSLLPHQLRHEGHAGRHVKAVNGTDKESKEQYPAIGFMAGPQKKTQKGCLKKVEKLGSQKDFPFIVLINPKPCKKGEKKAGCKLAGSQQPQQKSRIRHGIYQPLLGSELKPESNQRNPLGHPEYSIISDLQRRK